MVAQSRDEGEGEFDQIKQALLSQHNTYPPSQPHHTTQHNTPQHNTTQYSTTQHNTPAHAVHSTPLPAVPTHARVAQHHVTSEIIASQPNFSPAHVKPICTSFSLSFVDVLLMCIAVVSATPAVLGAPAGVSYGKAWGALLRFSFVCLLFSVVFHCFSRVVSGWREV